MIAFSDWLWQPWHSFKEYPGIDLGNGRTLPAEDVLEGHFRRVASQQPPNPSAKDASAVPRASKITASSVTTVTIQVEDNLKSAITLLAPDLMPLADIAEEVADAVSQVQPEPVFRQQLHQALERTHREHAVQRALGTRPVLVKEDVEQRWWFVTSVVTCTTIIVTVIAVCIWRRHCVQSSG